jgi:hypothetical protein
MGDPFKSDGGRIVLEQPFELLSAGRPGETYPQELALRIRVALVDRSDDQGSGISYLPNDEIVDGVTGLLAVYLRRAISVCGPIGTREPEGIPTPPILKEIPLPIVGRSRKAPVWPRLPLTTITGPQGVTYKDPNPEELAVSPNKLQSFFQKAGRHPQTQKLVDAARHYRRALELLFTQPDLAYVLFVFAADSLAQVAYPSEERSEAARLASGTSKAVETVAQKFGLTPEQVRELCLASTDLSKHKSRGELFRKFMEQYGPGHQDQSMIFNTGPYLDLFKVEDDSAGFERAYKARSGYVHTATKLRDSVLVGTESTMSIFAGFDLFIDEERAPPVMWLERVVATSFRHFVEGVSL